MNEVYDDILGQVLRLKSTSKIVVTVEQGTIDLKLMEDSVANIDWFMVGMVDKFTMRPCTFFFYSTMSDDELEDTLTQVIEKLKLLINLNRK